MSLRYALLALLRVGPMTGYDLQKQFSTSVGHVWHAPDSQIYTELKKMTGEGLIEGEQQPRGERATKRYYHVTDLGERTFIDWLNTPPVYQRSRNAAHLRAAYLEAADPHASLAFLDAHIAHWSEELTTYETELARIKAGSSPMLNRRLASTPDVDRERVIAYKELAYLGLVQRARAEVAWAEKGRRLVEELEQPAPGAAPGQSLQGAEARVPGSVERAEPR